jgi:hypothetical protein
MRKGLPESLALFFSGDILDSILIIDLFPRILHNPAR